MSVPIPLLYFSNSLVRSPAEEHLLTLVRGLDRARFQPHLVCTTAVAAALSADLPADVPVVPLSLRGPGDVGGALGLVRVLLQRRIRILHSHLFRASLFASPLGRLCRVPVIVETPHVREHWRHGRLRSRFIVDRWVSRCVDRYIAVSEANAAYLTMEKQLPTAKVTVIPNGIDVGRFDVNRRPPDWLRGRLGFDGDDPVLVAVGQLEPPQGHRVLLDALSTVRSAFPGTRLVCIGEGSQRDALAARAGQLGLADAVRFVGYHSRLADWLAMADLTVLPSLHDGSPLAALASLAAGRPVVATAVDGTTEVVVDGKTGLTVPPREPIELAVAICRLLGNPGLRRRLARAGRRWIEERFTAERQLLGTQDLYLAELARRPPKQQAVGESEPSQRTAQAGRR